MSIDYKALERMLRGESQGKVLETCDFEYDPHKRGFEELVVKENVCYIVVGLLFNEKGDVLLIQEAKPSCYGKWYLPAGRMEANETIIDAVKREVLEEACLEFEPESLLCVEECGGSWVRVTLTGKVTGGKLKTTDQADSDSLQAMWWNREDSISLRCKDILPLIEMGAKQRTLDKVCLLPALQPQKLLYLQMLIRMSSSEGFFFLMHIDNVNSPDVDVQEQDLENESSLRPPTVRIHSDTYTFIQPILSFCNCAFDKNEIENCSIKIDRVLGIEHCGRSALGLDGMGIHVLIDIQNESEGLPPCKPSFSWVKMRDMKDGTAVQLLEALNTSETEHTVPLLSLKNK